MNQISTMTASIAALGLSKRYPMAGAADGWMDALKDVSFEVQPGEAVGLIGRNGAGKSTLLRILSRVTRPSAGYADVQGTVGALLEVGTGFHPELTGRENTYLSGAILGLSKRDVRARFDEIVGFAEIEPFIDTPVKRYSSGMYARLGFAVAAHLRPSILIVDEVLAVGDLAFQAKCLAHMHRLATDGTTVLFVSHNLLAVADLCSRGLVLDRGQLAFDGPTSDAVNRYRQAVATAREGGNSNLIGDRLTLRLVGQSPDGSLELDTGAPVRIDVELHRSGLTSEVGVILNVVIEAPDGQSVVHLRSDLAGVHLAFGPKARLFRTTIDSLPLAPGVYWLWARAVSIEPNDPFILDSERVVLRVGGRDGGAGVVMPPHRFEQVHAADRNPVGTAP